MYFISLAWPDHFFPPRAPQIKMEKSGLVMRDYIAIATKIFICNYNRT